MMGGRTGPLAWVILSRLGARRRVRSWETPHCGTPSVCWGWEAWPATPGDPSTHTQPQTLPRVPGRAGHAQPLTSRLQRRQEQQGQLQGQPHGLAPLPGERTGRALKARREACGGAGGDSAPGVRTRLLQRMEEGGAFPKPAHPDSDRHFLYQPGFFFSFIAKGLPCGQCRGSHGLGLLAPVFTLGAGPDLRPLGLRPSAPVSCLTSPWLVVSVSLLPGEGAAPISEGRLLLRCL